MPSDAMTDFAARCLLQTGFIFQPVDKALEDFDVTGDEEAAVRALWDHEPARRALEDYWKAYKEADVPAVREPWYD